MIPKIIHYCWFGGNPLPEDVKQYIETWREYFPGYEIREWNENNFDVTSNQFANEAYQARKWAFVSDYVRVYALYHYGGIYMDTDIEAKKNIEQLLGDFGTVLGFEDSENVLTAFFASVPQAPFLKDLMEAYSTREFVLPDGSYNTEPNPILFTKILTEYGLSGNGKKQVFGDNCCIYPVEYFSAFNIAYQKFEVTENTCLVHHCIGSWQTPKDKQRQKLKSFMLKVIGEKNFEMLKSKFYKK